MLNPVKCVIKRLKQKNIKGKALLFVGVILLTIVGAAAFESNATSSMSSTNISKTNVNGKDVQKSTITSEDAKDIAKKHIEEPNATVGEVETIKEDNKETKVVPVIDNGKRVGEISIDPEAGEVTGGAGGAP